VPPVNTSDATSVSGLTRRLARGDETAFREFHALYFERLYHFLLLVTHGQKHPAQDALQETLLRVARYAREFDDEEVFWCWLKAIARNAARDGGRKRRRYLALLDTFAFLSPSPEPAAPAEDNRLRELVDEGLGELDANDRLLLEQKYLRGATVADLATQTGSSEKAIESRLLRLRRQLAAVLLKKLGKP
jgi:RNA polymerase sigma-70 factor, ECF subfamily